AAGSIPGGGKRRGGLVRAKLGSRRPDSLGDDGARVPGATAVDPQAALRRCGYGAHDCDDRSERRRSARTMSRVISVRGLQFRYPDGTQALDGVDFDLEVGETVALLGSNGSGKTTFVLHLNGLLRGEGRVEVCGLELTNETIPGIRSKVGLVFQD